MNQTSTFAEEPGVPTLKPGHAGPKYPGVRVTCNGNALVAQHVEVRITEGSFSTRDTCSSQMGQNYTLTPSIPSIAHRDGWN
jgi:pyruvate-ferredoxin/flavodoxin oxidoreductase